MQNSVAKERITGVRAGGTGRRRWVLWLLRGRIRWGADGQDHVQD